MLRSTMSLMGPIKQLFKMFEKGRAVATLIYFAAMFATLFSAIRVSPPPAISSCLQALGITPARSPGKFCKEAPSCLNHKLFLHPL